MVNWNFIRSSIKNEPDFLPNSSEPEVGEFLLALARMEQAKTILEIGTFKGFTTTCLIESGAEVYTVDIKDQRSSVFKEEAKDYHQFIEMDSVKFLEITSKRFDLVFVDGWHAKEQVYKELDLLKKLFCGTIVLHDPFSTPDVMEAIRDFSNVFGYTYRLFRTPRQCGLAIL